MLWFCFPVTVWLMCLVHFFSFPGCESFIHVSFVFHVWYFLSIYRLVKHKGKFHSFLCQCHGWWCIKDWIQTEPRQTPILSWFHLLQQSICILMFSFTDWLGIVANLLKNYSHGSIMLNLPYFAGLWLAEYWINVGWSGCPCMHALISWNTLIDALTQCNGIWLAEKENNKLGNWYIGPVY